MYRPGGMSSDEESDWEDNYFSPVAKKITCSVRSSLPPEKSVEELLLEAVIDKDIEKVKELILKGADVNFSPTNNWNSLIQASADGSYDIVKLLVEKGADVNISHEKFTPLLAICSSSNRNEENLLRCLDLLIAEGAKVNICDWSRLSALSHAVRQNHKMLVVKLVEEGADVNVSDQDGWTPIFYAVNMSNLEMVELLIELGANKYCLDRNGLSLLDFALEKENSDIVKLLSGGLETNKWFITFDESSYFKVDSVKRILSTFPGPNDRLSGYMLDVYNMLRAVQLTHLTPYFFDNYIGLGHFLTSNEESLKDIGIKFWFERHKILRMIENFHEYPWDMTSFGMPVSHNESDLYQTAKLMATLSRQLYLISITSYWWSKQGGFDDQVVSTPSVVRESLRTIKILRGKVKTLQTITRELDEEDITPSDIILPTKQPESLISCPKVLLSCCVIFGLFVVKWRLPFFLHFRKWNSIYYL